MIFQSLYSGSSGNCLLVSHKDTTLLIDAGLPGVRIVSALSDYNRAYSSVDALLITHEHDDHICGAGVFHRKSKAQIYANTRTCDKMLPRLGKIKKDGIVVFDTAEPFAVKDLEILPFYTSHDAAEPVGFRISDGVHAVGIATDLGIVSENVLKILSTCEVVLLEANHDVDMLICGPYPVQLKKRILADTGHLSNEDSGKCCKRLIEAGVSRLYLGHLSQQNNKPLIALNTVTDILSAGGMTRNKDYVINIAGRDRPCDPCELN